jgi:hypothetical protein
MFLMNIIFFGFYFKQTPNNYYLNKYQKHKWTDWKISANSCSQTRHLPGLKILFLLKILEQVKFLIIKREFKT